MQSVQIKSDSIVMVDIDSIRQHPKNRNTHPQDQIDHLAKVIAYQGFRDPLIISKRSGLLISGHGRVLAAKQLGMTQVPVTMQDFEDDVQEYAALVSENAVASWAELDLSGINADIGDLGPEFDIDLLGLHDFKIEVADLPDLPDGEKSPLQQRTFTLTDDQADKIEQALEIAKGMGAFGDTGNENSNGNALARVCELFSGAHSDG